MSEDPDKLDEEELESLLRRLRPSPLDVGRVAEYNRERERVLLERSLAPSKMQWSRVVPLVLVGTVAMFGFALHRYGERLRLEGASASTPPPAAATLVRSEEKALPSSVPVALDDPRFLPVSVHGTVVNTSSGGVVETESGPRERLSIEYRDAFHWHDPESGTNVRLFRPRTEEFVVPLPTD